MTRLGTLAREVEAVIVAGRKLRANGWHAAALDLERKKNLRGVGYPGWIVQSIFLSRGRYFATIALRPSPKPSRSVLRDRDAREIEAIVGQTILHLGYGFLADMPRRTLWASFRDGSRLRNLDADWNQVIQASRSRSNAKAVRVSPPILKRTIRSERATAGDIWRALQLLEGPDGGWRPDYLCFRKNREFRAMGLLWRATFDLVFGGSLGVMVSALLQPDGRINASGRKRLKASGWFDALAQGFKSRGFVRESGPVHNRATVYAGYRYPGLTLGTLYRAANLLNNWNPPDVRSSAFARRREVSR